MDCSNCPRTAEITWWNRISMKHLKGKPTILSKCLCNFLGNFCKMYTKPFRLYTKPFKAFQTDVKWLIVEKLDLF